MNIKEVPDFKDYFADDQGNVYSNKGGSLKKLSPRCGKKGRYYTVVLYNGKGKRTPLLIHRVIAYTFLGKPEDSKLEINHKNLNRFDNRLENIEWVSHSENIKHHDSINGRRVRGSKTRTAKLNVYQVLEILENKEKLTQRQLAKIYGVKQSNIWAIVNRKSWNDFSIKLELERLKNG